jgi:hypothetical protein
MDSRLGTVENIRAARVSMIPGGAEGIPIPENDDGRGGYSIIKPKDRPVPKTKSDVPTTRDMLRTSEMRAAAIEQPWYTDNAFTGVLCAGESMNGRYTRKPKSYNTVKNFPIIETEKYPEPPAYWQMFSGESSRNFGRTDALRFQR